MFDRSVGKKPVPYIASSRTSTGGSIGVKPCRREPVEREAVEREREQRRVAEQVAEARAREPRGPLHVEAADLGVLLRVGELRLLAPAPDLDRVLVGRPRRARTGRAGSGRETAPASRRPRRRRAPPRRLSARPSARPAPRAAPASASPSASGGRAARRRRERARASARRPRAARRRPPRRPCARARRGSASGSLRAALRSIISVESRYVSINSGDPVRLRPGDHEVGAVEQGRVRLARRRSA